MSLSQPEPNSISPPTPAAPPRLELQWLVGSDPSTHEPNRRQARLLCVLSLVGSLLYFSSVLVSIFLHAQASVPILMGITSVLLAITYGLVRSGRYEIGLIVGLGLQALVSFFLLAAVYDGSTLSVLTAAIWIALTILIGKILLSTRGTMLLALVMLAGLVLEGLFLKIPLDVLLLPVYYMAAVSVLVVVGNNHRDMLENDRLSELSAANQALERLRASLEAKVVERTRDLERANQELNAEIAERQYVEDALQKARAELELRVEERTLELAQANFALTRQIKAQKLSEAALSESEERFRTLFESSPDAIVLYDPQVPTWPIVDCNQSLGRMIGYSREELLGQPLTTATGVKYDPVRVAQSIDRLRREGRLDFEMVQRRKDGSNLQVEIAATLVTLRGRELVLGIGRDISARKQAEQARLKFELGIERSGEAVFMTDPDGTITYVNPAFEKTYGFSKAEAVGKTPRILKSGYLSPERYRYF